MFMLPINKLQPSQFYLSEQKVEAVRRWFTKETLKPLPVKRLGERIFLTDGHSRAFVAYEQGMTEVPVVWDEDDWPFYDACVLACEERGVFTVKDLKHRQLSPREFEEKWLGFCSQFKNSD